MCMLKGWKKGLTMSYSLFLFAQKPGRHIPKIDRILPEGDFPSPDGNWPLKIALLEL